MRPDWYLPWLSFRDDAFQAQPAGVLEDHLALLAEVLAEAQGGRGACEQLPQPRLALDQRRAAQVVAVEIEKVEKIEDEAVGAAFAEVGLEGAEIRRAAAGFHHHLAVEYRFVHG